MTWVYDGNGRRWVDPQPRKRRKPARPLRFGAIKVGDQVMKVWSIAGLSRAPAYYLVTDLWFDPVAGQRDPVSGNMVAIQRIRSDGEPHGRKEPHTVRGLASQSFKYADRDYIAFCIERSAAITAGQVVGINRGHIIRRRPKMPGGGL